jgi:hypothetical protein
MALSSMRSPRRRFLVKKVRKVGHRKVTAAALRQEAKQRAKLYQAIGEFIFEFSQLEFTIRVALGSALSDGPVIWDDERFDTVISPYDFATLCRVAQRVFESKARTWAILSKENEIERIINPPKKDEIERTFKACLAMNDERVRIAHGTWTLAGGARHVARGSLKAQFHFEQTEKIEDKSREVSKLRTSVGRLILFARYKREVEQAPKAPMSPKSLPSSP